MLDKELTLPEFAALVVLAVEAGEVPNTTLKAVYGISLDGESRRKLNGLKLVDSRRQGRGYVHALADAGWVRLADALRKGDLPVVRGSAGAMLRAVLVTWLPGHLDRLDLRLHEAFGPGGSSGEAPIERPGEAPAERAAAPDAERAIRAVYTELAARPGAWVSLTRLRARLTGYPRDGLDQALTRMERLPDVNLVPESNQKTLTPEDRASAVVIGGQDKHLLWIGTP
ncbi:hypothetical protein OIE66_20645 [Nonomuraea sp. NBC_01738]|uniref:hypothetical protein n=1 Tax=Nonomuraea sp. NBC_01738 TaxID=2976003 RepID=UPI002E118CBC|nr:hypothetical protein OIE66_20645 [Nonomuraea sp. NBC_01738]